VEDNNDYTMIVVVAGQPGEECVSIASVSDTDMEVLEPMLIDIKNHRGYYPVGRARRPDKPTARDLYHNYQGWDVFESIRPQPLSGFTTILSVSLYREEPLRMQML
jgi:hypothetical protein